MNTKQKLFSAMYELIAEVGYEKASINQICEKAGIKKPSFYYFYKSKEMLFKEIINYGYGGDDEEESKLIFTTTNKEEYKKYLLEIGKELITEFVADIKWKKISAEIDLQATRNEEIKLLVNNYNNELKKYLKTILEHGKQISAFDKNFDIEIHTDILYVLIIGINYVLLSEANTNNLKVYNKIVEGMF